MATTRRGDDGRERDFERDDGAAGTSPPFPQVRPASAAELARLREARRFWDRPDVRHWLATGEWPDDDEGGADDDE